MQGKDIKVLKVGPNIDDPNQIGGIITVILTILEVIKIPYVYFARSPKQGEKGFFGTFRWLFKIREFIRLVRSETPDIIHVHTAMNSSAIIRDYFWVTLGGHSKAKVLLHLHGGKYLFKPPKLLILYGITKNMLKKANSLVVLSSTEKNAVAKAYNLPLASIHVLENAISLDATKVYPAKAINLKCPSIVFLGRLSENKGLDDIVEALLELDQNGVEFQFHLYGQGPLQEACVSSLSSKIGKKFTFHGLVNGSNKWKALYEADIFLLPSRYGEGLPMTILEAMALGRVVVATNDASIGIVIRDKVNGFIVNKYSPQSIVEAILTIQKSPLDEIRHIQEKAVQTIEEGFSADVYMNKLENIYSKLTS